MREVGICSDEDLVQIINSHYDANGDSSYILEQLDSNCFRKFIKKAYPAGEE